MMDMFPACKRQHVSLIVKASEDMFVEGYNALFTKIGSSGLRFDVKWEEGHQATLCLFSKSSFSTELTEEIPALT